jgi:hypothetical protein
MKLPEEAYLEMSANQLEITHPFVEGKNKIWPTGNDSLDKIANSFYINCKYPLLSKKTIISSIGNCNAFKFSSLLQNNGYNFPVYEDNLHPEFNTHSGSTKIGAIFNAGALLQTIQWSFNLDQIPQVYYRTGADGKTVVSPFREEVLFTEEDLLNFDIVWNNHLKKNQKLFSEVEILVIFLDTTECFRFLPTNHFYHRFPFGSELIYAKYQQLGLLENVELLSKSISILSSFNPKIHISLAVSPSPPLYTNNPDNHVVSATGLNKSILRLATEEVCRKYNNVSYFPFYETVMYPGKINAWEDSRHPSNLIYEKAFKTFEEIYKK